MEEDALISTPVDPRIHDGIRASRKNNEFQVESQWKWLPSDLLFTIFSSLNLSDLIRSALVCKRWRISVVDAHRHRRELPCFWAWRNRPNQLYSMPDRCFYALKLLSELMDFDVIAIHEDWVGLLARPTWGNNQNIPMSCSLYNPFSGARIQLPPLDPYSGYSGEHRSSPEIKLSCNPSQPGCLAACLHQSSQGLPVGFCRVGDDTGAGWKMIPCSVKHCSIAFHLDLIYLATLEGGLNVADPVSMEIKTMLPPPTIKNVPPMFRLLSSEDINLECKGGFKIYSSGKELLMVSFIQGSPIAIYRADFELERWEILDNLKGQAVLLDRNSLLWVKPDKMYDLRKDCVYIIPNNKPTRMFRILRQSCSTFNMVKDVYEDEDEDFNMVEDVYEGEDEDFNMVEDVYEDEDEDEEENDYSNLIFPLVYQKYAYPIIFMLTPKPKFFLHKIS